MLKNAKDLIAKGKALGDPELIQMGMDLLEQYTPNDPYDPPEPIPELKPEQQEPQYVCENCGHTMPVDKEGRKRCPECKKHKLVLERPTPPKIQKRPSPEALLATFEAQQAAPKPQERDLEQFHMQVRDRGSSRIHYDDEGNPDGVIRRTEQIDTEGIHNIWQDDGEEEKDAANELLKKFTKISPRTRTPVNYVEVACESCNRVEKLHPIHAGGRGRHLCVKCIKRRSGR
jgi:DNA-directed RNA polymerase subunit RPC12/RpoP